MAIYDCFTFYNEYELLKFRLEYYCDYVDFFVISECCKTQRGESKNYNFEEHKTLYKQWLSKIIYIKADRPPELQSKDDWSIENYQRDCIRQGLEKCKPDDIIFISDLDEFYNIEILKKPKKFNLKKINTDKGKKNSLKQIKNILCNNRPLLFKHSFYSVLQSSPIGFEQQFFYYFMNYRWNKNWHGSIVTLYKNMTTPQQLRDNRNYWPFISPKKEPAGWHFSYLGGKEQIKRKLASIIEGSQAKIIGDIDLYIEECLKQRKDLFNRDDGKLFLIDPKNIGLKNISQYIRDFKIFFYN